MKQIRVAIATVGCRANQADSATLTRHLDSRFVSIVKEFDQADVVVVNTCCVTREAERDCRKTTRRALRASEGARVLLLGCAVNALPEFGNELGSRVIKVTGKDAEPGKVAAWIHRQVTESIPGSHQPISTRTLGRTRALIKIQNGCTHHCTYCIVPKARGKETSVPLPEVQSEIKHLQQDGFSEIVLTGVQLGAWGKDLPGSPTLAQLLERAGDAVSPGRIRLSSIEPWSVDKHLIDIVSSHPRICPHFHIPLQNGDDSILEAMGRGYLSDDYATLVTAIRRAIPDASLGTDVLLGFPGETERCFENTLKLLDIIRPSYIHAFSYSPRPGTRAAKFSGRPTTAETRERTRRVREMGAQYATQFRASHIGQVREIIAEEVGQDGTVGITDNFIGVLFLNANPAAGSLVRARLVDNPGETNRLGAIIEDL